MATYATKKVILELKEILQASKLKPVVTTNEPKPLAETTEDIRVDIAFETAVLDLDRPKPDRTGYSRTALITIDVSANCSDDILYIYDVVDELEHDILQDNTIWQTVTNRDIVTVTYDRKKIGDYRSATILVEALLRLECYE